jgi:hypothetical protein
MNNAEFMNAVAHLPKAHLKTVRSYCGVTCTFSFLEGEQRLAYGAIWTREQLTDSKIDIVGCWLKQIASTCKPTAPNTRTD